MEFDATPTTLDAPIDAGLVIAVEGQRLEAPARAKLLHALRHGEGPAALTLDVVAFRQAEAPNRRYVRFRASGIRAFARSFVGMPVLRDHAQHDHSAIAGEILASEWEGAEGHGLIRQSLRLVKPWAIESALDGTMRRFSIGWLNTAPIACSECEAPYQRTIFGSLPSCEHVPGDEVEIRGGGKRPVETVVTSAEGVEVSAVTVPAVRGTGVEAVRAALSALKPSLHPVTVRVGGIAVRADDPERFALGLVGAFRKPKGDNTMLEKFRSVLGVADDAGDDAILAAAEKLAATAAADREALKAATARLADLEGKLAAAAAAEHEKALDELLTEVRRKRGQKLGAAGTPIRGGTAAERSVLTIAKHSLDEARQFVADMEPTIPLGRGLLSRTPEPAPAERRVVIDDVQRRMNRLAGVSDDDYARYLNGPAPAGKEAK